jgi:hypothetical protein
MEWPAVTKFEGKPVFLDCVTQYGYLDPNTQ